MWSKEEVSDQSGAPNFKCRVDGWSQSLRTILFFRTRTSLSWPNRYLSPSNSSLLGLHLVLSGGF